MKLTQKEHRDLIAVLKRYESVSIREYKNGVLTIRAWNRNK